ncbi:MAG: tetratricopeptide repeat protein [bacterium]|nr:tetratricopeptide repeat protein [bacterium]
MMDKKTIVYLVFTLILVTLSSAELVWTTDYENSVLEARRREKFLLLFFYSATDKSSQTNSMEQKTLMHKDTVPYLTPFILVKIEINHKKDLALKYQVTKTPTIIFTKPNGNELDRVTGYIPVKKFLKLLIPIAEQNLTYGTPDNLIKQLKLRPKDISVLYAFGVEQVNIKDYKYAERIFRQILELDAIDEFGYGEVTRLNLGYCLLATEQKQEQLESAITIFEELLKKYPQTKYRPEIEYQLGVCYLTLGDKERAKTIFQSSLPNAPEPWFTKIKLQLENINH